MGSTARKSAFPDATTLISLANEMSTSTQVVIDRLGQFFSTPTAQPISKLVKRIGDTASILSMRSFPITAYEIAELAQQIEAGAIPVNSDNQQAITDALNAIKNYLAVAATGKVSSGSTLFKEYEAVSYEIPGRKKLKVSELFLPISPIYANNVKNYNQQRFVKEVGVYRSEFSHAMAQFNTHRSLDSINAMRTSMVTMETKHPPSNFRMFFSLSISFFDVAIRNDGKIEVKDLELLKRIDDVLSSASAGNMEIDENTISWLMHSIGNAAQFSIRIKSFQDLYDLPRLMDDDVVGSISQQQLNNIQIAFENARKAWESAMMVSGELQPAKSTSFALLAVSNSVGDYALKTLSMAIGSLADGVVTASVPVNQETAVFGASVLLAIEDRISRITQDPRGGRAVAEFHRDRVRAVLAGNSLNDKSLQAPLIGTYSSDILAEVINNISATEQIIDQCIRDGAKENKVNEALKLFAMVRSALMLLNMEDGATYAVQVEQVVQEQMAKLLAGEKIDSDVSMKMAEGVMILNRYIRLVQVDPVQAAQALVAGRKIFDVADDDLDEVPVTILEDDMPCDFCEDEELGPIFFEEAKDVIANIVGPGLIRMRLNPLDEQALVEVRRGFHTLKGSARMVELNNLGQVGQQAEYALNICRDNKYVNPNLAMVNWLEDVASSFTVAIEQLEGGHRAQIDVASAEAVYKRFAETNAFEYNVGVVEKVVAPEFDRPDVYIPEVQSDLLALEEQESVDVAGAILEDIVSEAGIEAEETDEAEVDLSKIFEIEAEVEVEVEPPIMESFNEVAVDTDEIPPLPESLVAPLAPESNPEVRLGDTVIPSQLYNAFVAEAKNFYDDLDMIIRDNIKGERPFMEYEAMRLAHSLAGMGRTTGLSAITELAVEIENWTSIMHDHKVNVNDDQATTLRDALEALEGMIIGVEDGFEPIADQSVITRMKILVSDAEHTMAHGRDECALTEAELAEIELGGEVSDTGIKESELYSPEVALDGESTLISAGEISAVHETSFESTQVISSEEDEPHVIGDTVEKTSLDESLADAVADEISASSLHIGGDIIIEPVSKTQPQAVVIDETELMIPLMVEAPSDHSVILDDGFTTTTMVLSSLDAEAPDAIFVAPSTENSLSQGIEESQMVIPPTVQTDIGTTTSTSIRMIGAASEKSENSDWLEIVRKKEDDIDSEMLEIFIEEAEERFLEIDAALTGLDKDIGDKKMFLSLKRSIHTLKGSSNTAGSRKIGALFHYLEDMMNESPSMSVQLFEVVQAGVDAAFAGIEAIKNGRSVESAIQKLGRATVVKTKVREDEDASISECPASSVPISLSDVHESTTKPVVGDTYTETRSLESTTSHFKSRKSTKKEEDDSASLRVSAKALDRMVKNVGEINISRSRMSANVDLSKISMHGLAASLGRMNEYLKEIEVEAEKQMSSGSASVAHTSNFDALQMDRFTRLQELTRRVAEAQNDLMMQQSATLGAVREMEEALATQNVLISDLSTEMDQIRQVRVSSIVPALKRVVRAACRDTSKSGEIYFDADVEIDRGILDKIGGPIEHILRNAVAHGIESPEDRIKAGKAEQGTIEFRANQDGNEVFIEIRDDGCGIDANRVLSKAVEKGLVKPGTRMSEEKVYELLFEPGFTTAEVVTDIAGRGVGLDVVRSQISAMGGRVDVISTKGSGTTFIMRLPATLTVIAGAAVTTNGHMYVIPVSFIDRLIRIGPKDLENAYKAQKLIIKDSIGETVEYNFYGMWELVGSPSMENRPTNRNSILLMRGSRTAVHIDDIRPAAEYVFRPMGPQLVAGSGLIGSTINSSGNATLVIDPIRVARHLGLAAAQVAAGNGVREIARAVRTPLVLIVDDSLTVRKVTSRLLKKEGYRHFEAENGMQALERLQDERPDVILMDIEMPVMNGYEATQAIRATAETSDIPIIMITSRVGESHRQRAMDLGVNEYLGKPYNDNDLMGLIRKYCKNDTTNDV